MVSRIDVTGSHPQEAKPSLGMEKLGHSLNFEALLLASREERRQLDNCQAANVKKRDPGDEGDGSGKGLEVLMERTQSQRSRQSNSSILGEGILQSARQQQGGDMGMYNNGNVPQSMRKRKLSEEVSESQSASSSETRTPAAKRGRMIWTEELHRRFENAVNHLGINNAVPKTILAMMNVDGVTRENVASHLQKWRAGAKREASLAAEYGQSQSKAHAPVLEKSTKASGLRQRCASFPNTSSLHSGTTALGLPINTGSSLMPNLPAARPLCMHPQNWNASVASYQAAQKLCEMASQNRAALVADFQYPSQPPPYFSMGPYGYASLPGVPKLDIAPLTTPAMPLPSPSQNLQGQSGTPCSRQD